MKCALCLAEVTLQESHIVPEFMFQGFYGHKHCFVSVNRSHEDKPTLHQKGLRERLLCKDCELHFSRWEKYASDTLYGEVANAVKQYAPSWRFVGIDYSKLKLLLLSLLWRYSVAKTKEYRGVDLGRHHGEVLRTMLLNSNPGDVDEYPCFVGAVMDGKSWFNDLIRSPIGDRVDARRRWMLTIGGFLFIYVVSAHRIQPKEAEFLLQMDGRFFVVAMDYQTIPGIMETAAAARANASLIDKWLRH
jgi:hypothetical protein